MGYYICVTFGNLLPIRSVRCGYILELLIAPVRYSSPPVGYARLFHIVIDRIQSFGYAVSTPKGDNRLRGHLIHATRVPEDYAVVVKCIRMGDPEARMMAYFYALRKQGKNLPVVDVLDLIEDRTSGIVLVVLEDWGCNLAELGKLSPLDFFHILRQCFEVSYPASIFNQGPRCNGVTIAGSVRGLAAIPHSVLDRC
ncbi:hypothetical protein ACGC1H_004217 [Rhizoctonia solani]